MDASHAGQLGGAERTNMAVLSEGPSLSLLAVTPQGGSMDNCALACCVPVELALGMLPAARWQSLLLGEDGGG